MPLFDSDYDSAAEDWIRNFELWQKGKHPEQDKSYNQDTKYYWEYDSPPDPEYHRTRKWTPEEATAYQVYSTVSEGTPVSPVFETTEALQQWLVEQGHSEHAAARFIETGWAPSGMALLSPATGQRTYASNVDVYDLMQGGELGQ
jgi:hypothetical protein